MSLESRYSPREIEGKWYHYWESKEYFKSVPDERESFSVVIPPPNITGILHMGHILNNTIQDILIRRARLLGKNACWVPGTDHASIATEAKVVQMLREKGIKKSDLSREQFLEYAFEWKDKYGGIILNQLRRLGASCDWSRTAFTMDEIRSEAVLKVFVDLYRKGKLYRGQRMINWDPDAKTVLSSEEVLYKEEPAQLFYIKYFLEDSPDEYVVIATQRPETIMADSAVAVHPDDKRYLKFKGKKVIIPLIQKSIPIIEDEYVDREFGTGALKVTPAHDQNDYEIGLRHQLEVVDILNEDGSLNESAKILVGEDRFAARKKIKKLLEESGHLEKVTDYMTNIGRSERTNAVVEPRLSLQWYVDMKSLSEPALKAVMSGEIGFVPENFQNTYKHWMENIRDWCISRQLWWGHQIPVWYYGDDIFVAETAEEALQEAKTKTGNHKLAISDLVQDADVLDTWFSSWLWPISVFDGFKNDEELKYYYPTSVLVTGWDIIFLWVARMIMAGYEWKGQKPFNKVYFTGMVRDKLRRKMSKSLGNSPDALGLLDEFGADGVRFGMLACSPAGGDLLFDEKLCEQGRNFSNKLWNAQRLIVSWTEDDQKHISEGEQIIMKWLDSRMSEIIAETNLAMDNFKLSEALKTLYSFIWEDFCGFYLEVIKPRSGENITAALYKHAVLSFEKICTILHPFMPFITEEIWHNIKERKAGEDCMVSKYPISQSQDQSLLYQFQEIRHVITQIRDLRNKYQIKSAVPLDLFVLGSNEKGIFELKGAQDILLKLANIQAFHQIHEELKQGQSFMGLRHKYFLQMPVVVNVEEEQKNLAKEIEYAQGFVNSVQKKLENEKFVSNAPAELLEKERQKFQDGLTRLEALKASLQNLGN
ncbi:MAG: valine--tRNA ligase [Saprospiraceae bacterium]|nr:valine--tRNA ligase [Saprospiraceae bacterium]